MIFTHETTKSAKQRPKKGYDAHKEAAKKRQAEQSLIGRDISEIPKPINPRLVKSCRLNLEKFCLSYFPEMFPLPFSPDHINMIRKIEAAVLKGKLYAMALPRGSGKTTICQCACLWASLYGHRHFILLIAASQDKAQQLIDEIKVWCETNEKLIAGFPAALFPVAKLERIAQRAKGQTYEGKPTRINWTGNEIVWPSIPAAPSRGGVIKAIGMSGSDIRGAKASTAEGGTIRPDFVLLDDFQTRESAASPTQCRKILKILNGDILGVAGPGKSISGLAACTIIEPGDAAEQLVDRAASPEWQGERVSFFKSWPERMDLWDKYAEFRLPDIAEGGDGSEATAFYEANQTDMTKGCSVYWPERHKSEEVDAIQHGMNIFFRDKKAFASEMQNAPEYDDGEIATVTAEDFRAKLIGFAEFTGPDDADRAVAHIDVQGDLLFYSVAIGNRKMTANIAHFGSWPQQREKYFTNENARVKLSDKYAGKSFEAYMRQGLIDCIEYLRGLELRTSLGDPVSLRAIGIDANWGESTDIVYDVCAKYPDVWPMHGRYVGATSKPFKDRKRKRGDILRDGYHIPRDKGNHPCRHVAYDSNAKKGFVLARFLAPEGEDGSWAIWGEKTDKQEMFIDHMTSEYGVDVTARGRTVREYKMRPNAQNHHFDNVTGCGVLLSMEGCALPDHKAGKRVTVAEKPKHVSFAEIQRAQTKTPKRERISFADMQKK
jgi:hypothetical protein